VGIQPGGVSHRLDLAAARQRPGSARLRNYGFDDDVATVFEAMIEAASRFPDYRLPELFAGSSRTA
jgi:hypothetical protein